MDAFIETSTQLKTADFIQFYENLDLLKQKNFQAHTTRAELLRSNWRDYTKVKMGVSEDVPESLREIGKQHEPMYAFMADKGMIDRFYPEEIISVTLPIEKVRLILGLMSTTRSQTDFLYYTDTKPGNPLYEKPIADIGEGMYQVFEIKQVIHAIENLLEEICTSAKEITNKYVKIKGNLLEARIVELFSNFFKTTPNTIKVIMLTAMNKTSFSYGKIMHL